MTYELARNTVKPFDVVHSKRENKNKTLVFLQTDLLFEFDTYCYSRFHVSRLYIVGSK
jgi:hypothetical protein